MELSPKCGIVNTIVAAALDCGRGRHGGRGGGTGAQGGTVLEEGEKAKLTTNLLTVICGENAAPPTISLNSDASVTTLQMVRHP
eukprot:COSAG01_NODE_391_length_17672_cov_4.507369_10_plen_84_part_00